MESTLLARQLCRVVSVLLISSLTNTATAEPAKTPKVLYAVQQSAVRVDDEAFHYAFWHRVDLTKDKKSSTESPSGHIPDGCGSFIRNGFAFC